MIKYVLILLFYFYLNSYISLLFFICFISLFFYFLMFELFNMFMYVYVYIYISIYLYVYGIYIYVCICIYRFIHIIYVYIYIYIYVCMYVSKFTKKCHSQTILFSERRQSGPGNVFSALCWKANWELWHSVQTTIPLNHPKVLGLSRSKIKWWAIHPNLSRNVIVRLSHPRSGMRARKRF